jgi:hypothetical protein
LADLLLWISTVNQRIQSSGSRYTILPFKLHQFIAQTGSVYTTLGQDENRFITLEPGIYKQDDGNKKPIFPNVFSRATGHPFICVSRVARLRTATSHSVDTANLHRLTQTTAHAIRPVDKI